MELLKQQLKQQAISTLVLLSFQAIIIHMVTVFILVLAVNTECNGNKRQQHGHKKLLLLSVKTDAGGKKEKKTRTLYAVWVVSMLLL